MNRQNLKKMVHAMFGSSLMRSGVLFLPGPLVSVLSGSVGGQTFGHNRFGQWIKQRTTPVNPNSAEQIQVRSIFAALADAWANVLTDVQRTAWNLYGNTVVMKNRVGEDVHLTGMNHYIRSNSIVLRAAGTRIDDAPTTFTLGPQDPELEATASESTQLLSVAFDATLPWLDEDNAFMQILMSSPQSPGTEFIGGPFRLAGYIAGDSVTPLTSPQTMTVPFAVTEGQVIAAKARILLADGRLSQPFWDQFSAGA